MRVMTTGTGIATEIETVTAIVAGEETTETEAPIVDSAGVQKTYIGGPCVCLESDKVALLRK